MPLRAIPREVAPNWEHLLDWFHMSVRFQHVILGGPEPRKDLSQDRQTVGDGWVDRAKWRLQFGKSAR